MNTTTISFSSFLSPPSPSLSPMAFTTASARLLRLSIVRTTTAATLFRPAAVSAFRFSSSSSAANPGRSIKLGKKDETASVVLNAALNDNGSAVSVEDERIVPVELHKEATEAYMSYAMSVLLGRALPDVRDGLKPVHRRILFAMHELGLSSKKPFKKCARVVGEVLGKFHPHGDSAVYEALVRMAQDFSLRTRLIHGHGNFGSIDADPAAAMRYTECRLEALTEEMLLADLEQDTVDFTPNFDSSQKEPSVFPARLPLLLLNGSSGIAVGMATNIPPHNLGEVVDALSVLIHNPEATVDNSASSFISFRSVYSPELEKCLGCWVILEAYRTGRGRVVIRGKIDVESVDSKIKRSAIIIKEIPYQTNKASLVEKIANLVENKILEGISDIRDESDRSGMRVVIELKRGAEPAIVLNNLYRYTALQSSFSCNMVGILNGQPKLMGLKEILQAFLDFRCSVIERRTQYKLSHAKDRRHIVEGIIVGLDNLDDVIQVIRKASSNAMASADLMKEYSLSQKQAEAILDINLRKLTMLERNKFLNEDKLLMEQISRLEDLLSSKKHILQLIEHEAIELRNKFSTPRRSTLEESETGQVEDIDVIPNEEMILAISEKGYVKRMSPNTFHAQQRGTIGKSVGKMRVDDMMSDFIVCRAHDHLLYFSDKGIVYSARAYKIPECTRAAAGTPLVQILSLSDGERITSIIPVSEFVEDRFLVMLTANGYIKKVSLSFFSSIRSTGIIAIQLVSGDELKWVRCCSNDDLIAMASQNGMVILSSCDTVRSVGRVTRGAIAMRLKGGDNMASMDIIPASLRRDLDNDVDDHGIWKKGTRGPWLLFISESGHGKRVPLSRFRLSPLNRVGLIGYKFAQEDRLAAVFVVGFSQSEDGESDEHIILVSHSGTINRIKVKDISIQSRFARGVILMRLEHLGKIQSAQLIAATETESDEDDAVGAKDQDKAVV
ncbi:hypothetical protein KSS87_023695 [Heliosperma pusillum]|nr:hypothetical protein KSS87_023695 [Heliosperma pusillum]